MTAVIEVYDLQLGVAKAIADLSQDDDPKDEQPYSSATGLKLRLKAALAFKDMFVMQTSKEITDCFKLHQETGCKMEELTKFLAAHAGDDDVQAVDAQKLSASLSKWSKQMGDKLRAHLRSRTA